ncbi:MAG TPA: hypothetical protein VK797_07405 [Tepidisphaeraceae bacterium]|nr:hypothetical protein [Tepidisphaeraceae bacterium]
MTERSRVYHNAHGVRRTLIADDERPDRFVVRTQQDVEPVLASVERDRAIMAHDGVNKLLARIPVSIFERSVHEQWDEGDWKKWLNSSEAAPFRVWPGRV